MTAPLRLILDVWNPARGGLEHYAETLARGLADRDLPVSILCGERADDCDPPVPIEVTGHRGAAFYREVDRRFHRGTLGTPLSFRHPGAVGGVFLPLGGLFVEALERRRAAEPPWLRGPRRLARQFSAKTRGYLTRERAFFADGAPSCVLAPSQMVVDSVARHFPDYPGEVTATGLPVDPHRFRPASTADQRRARQALGLREDARVIAWIGHDAVRKGRDVAIRVANHLQATDPDVQLLLAGRGCALGQPDAPGVYALGPRDDVPTILHAADLLLLPTVEDAFPLVILEALACGLPVVTTSRTGSTELLRGTSIGHAVDDPGDVPALARACRAELLVGHAPARASHRRAAVEHLFTAAHLDRMAERLADCASSGAAV